MSQLKSGYVVRLALGVMVFGLATPALAQQTEFEVFGGSTMRLQGSRALVSTFDGRTIRTADSGERTALPSIGLTVSRWRGIFGSYLDFSYVDGGKASASIGANSSDVASRLFDFHGGIQVQAPSNRVRPYVLAAGGFAHASTDASLTLAGYTSSNHGSEWRSSFIYGGGVRFGFNETSGMRVALEGVTVSPFRSDPMVPSQSYGRFVVGVFFSSKPSRVQPAPVSQAPLIQHSAATSLRSLEPDGARNAIDQIRGGAHGTLPPPERLGRNSGGATTITYENETNELMTVYLAGSRSLALNLAPRTKQEVYLAPGSYEIAVRVADESVQPFYGTHDYARGMSHLFSFYIETSLARDPR